MRTRRLGTLTVSALGLGRIGMTERSGLGHEVVLGTKPGNERGDRSPDMSSVGR
jgi:aryl-alcohol dehydrogenase-like predicted oxidoreductase